MATHLILQKIFKTGRVSEPHPEPDPSLRTREGELQEEILKVFGQAAAIRHVDAGSCNGCELEIHALNGPHYNIEGVGVKFAASLRHVDILLVTGPVSRRLEVALKRPHDATPEPKWVVAMGDCAGGCGEVGAMFGENYACRGKVADVILVDVWYPAVRPPRSPCCRAYSPRSGARSGSELALGAVGEMGPQHLVYSTACSSASTLIKPGVAVCAPSLSCGLSTDLI